MAAVAAGGDQQFTFLSSPSGSPQVTSAAHTSVHSRWSNKLSAFRIEFCNDASQFPGTYLSGSTLNATVVLDISKPMTIVRIAFKCEGFAHVIAKKQPLISESKTLFGHESGRKSSTKKPAGLYKFPVSILLSADLPSTIFESHSMQVRYVCSATLCGRTSSEDILIERPFTVHHQSIEVINEVIQSQQPLHHRTEFSGLSATISLNRTGFYVGDQVNVTGVITNSNRNSRKVRVGLELIRSVTGNGEQTFLGFARASKKQAVSRVASRWGEYMKLLRDGTQPFAVTMDLHSIEPTERHPLLTVDYLLHVSFLTKHGLLGESMPRYATFALTIAPNVVPSSADLRAALLRLEPPTPATGSGDHTAAVGGTAAGSVVIIVPPQPSRTNTQGDNDLDLPPPYESLAAKLSKKSTAA